MTKKNYKNVLDYYFSNPSQNFDNRALRELVSTLKNVEFNQFVNYLKANPAKTDYLKNSLQALFKNKTCIISLTEANILSENAFLDELKKRIINKLLPPVENENTITYLVDNIFVKSSSEIMNFHKIDNELWQEFFTMMGVDSLIENEQVKKDIYYSIGLVSTRLIGNAMDQEVMRMAPEYKNFDNPFFALQNEIDLLIDTYKEQPTARLNSKNSIYKQIKIYLGHCFSYVEAAFKNSSKYGISSKINQSLLKIRQQLQRISDLTEVLIIDKEEDVKKQSVLLFKNILFYKSTRNNIRELVGDSTRLISHLITNHTAETGIHYITSSRKDYLKMFWKACAGGVIVGFLCILKMLYSYIDTSEFMHAFLYAFNYAMGFVMIYLMNFTLATKQPAMTASTLAKVLSEEVNTQKNYRDFAQLVSRLSRTQFISFIGNVITAFPIALLMIYGLDVLMGDNMATQKAQKLLTDLNPKESKALLHASIAGVFLFFSGIISGNIGNSSVFYNIPKRLEKHPYLLSILGQNTTKKLSGYYQRNWAGIVSNFWFGVMLGITAPIGIFLGLDLDIRHITFASGNLAMGLYGKGFNVETNLIFLYVTTVFLIGLCNFAVSFGLSILLALQSRKLKHGETQEIFKEIFKYFLKQPLSFFFPVKKAALNE